MVKRRVRFVAEACQVIRPVCLSVVAITILAVVMAYEGWRVNSIALAAVLALISVGLVLQVHRAVRELRRQFRVAHQTAEQAEEHYIQMLWRIIRFVEARDKYTRGHSDRVAGLAAGIARQLGLGDDCCRKLMIAGRLHDIGMIVVPENILNQANSIGADAFRTIKAHPEVGFEILKPLLSLREVLPAVHYHHERMNGTGYPDELKGEKIPLEARILAVADAYDAMTHDRPYRPALTVANTMAELRRCSPSGYDTPCVEALAEIKGLAGRDRSESPNAAGEVVLSGGYA